jgi:hypothetical protein
MRQHLLAPSALALSLVLVPLVGCGGGGDPAQLTQEGYAALASSDYAKAADKLGGALEGMQPGDPKHLQAKVGLCRALAHVDAARCTSEFQELVRAHSDQVQMGDVEVVVKELSDAKEFQEATRILETAKTTFPESPKIAALVDEVGDRASQAGDTGAMDALKGLGYAGEE